MKTIYIADDDTTFDDYYECENYEESMKHPNLYYITFMDSAGEELDHSDFKDGIFDDLLYQECQSLIVHDDREVSDIQWLADYCGWSEFEEITSPGLWKREDAFWDGVWKKEETMVINHQNNGEHIIYWMLADLEKKESK